MQYYTYVSNMLKVFCIYVEAFPALLPDGKRSSWRPTNRPRIPVLSERGSDGHGWIGEPSRCSVGQVQDRGQFAHVAVQGVSHVPVRRLCRHNTLNFTHSVRFGWAHAEVVINHTLLSPAAQNENEPFYVHAMG